MTFPLLNASVYLFRGPKGRYGPPGSHEGLTSWRVASGSRVERASGQARPGAASEQDAEANLCVLRTENLRGANCNEQVPPFAVHQEKHRTVRRLAHGGAQVVDALYRLAIHFLNHVAGF